MGFLEYAERFLLEKDPLKLKVILDEKQVYPSLNNHESVPEVRLPLPFIDKDAINYLGFRFPSSDEGKVRVGRLFRATVAHSSGRAIQKMPRIIEKKSPHAEFVENVLRDVHLDS